MLTSITPLGERGRGNRWWVTTAALILGGLGAGAAVGALAGALGAALIGGVAPGARLAILAGALVLGLLVELAGTRPPGPHRQVNEDWLGAYRGWVYGLGFGAQLGVGAATIVTTSTVYVTLIASFAAAGVGAGALIGGAFGAIRAATVLAGWRVHGPAELIALGRRLGRWRDPARRLALVAQGLLAIVAVAAIVV